MDIEERDFLHGLGLAAVVLISAALSATAVIGLGSALMQPTRPAAIAASPDLIASHD